MWVHVFQRPRRNGTKGDNRERIASYGEGVTLRITSTATVEGGITLTEDLWNIMLAFGQDEVERRLKAP